MALTAEEVRQRLASARPASGGLTAEQVRARIASPGVSASTVAAPGAALPTRAESVQAELAERTGPEQFLAGVGGAAARAGYGLKDLFVGLTPEDRRRLEEWQAITGGVATAGNIAGHVGMAALPMAGAARAAQAIPLQAVARNPGLTRAVAEATGAGAYGALATPGEYYRRGLAGMREGTSALLGHGAVAAATKPFQGLRRSPEGQAMLDEGVPLTPGAAAANPLWRSVESKFQYFPGVAGGTRNLQLRALEEQNRALMQRVTNDIPPSLRPEVDGVRPPVQISTHGPEGMRQMHRAFSSAYDDLWNRVGIPQNQAAVNNAAQGVRDMVSQYAGRFLDRRTGDAVRREFMRETESLMRGYGGPELQRFTRTLKDKLQKARDDDLPTKDLLTRVNNAWGQILDQISPGFARDASQLDRGYAQLAVLDRAANYQEAVRTGVFRPSDLSNAVTSMGSNPRVAQGFALLYPEQAAAQATIGNLTGQSNPLMQTLFTTGGLGLGAATSGQVLGGLPEVASAWAAGRAMTSEPMRRALLGQTRLQQALSPTEARAQALRVLGGRVGAATSAGTNTPRVP